MAWTAPRTWTTGENVTAALLNTHVRDNLLQAAPAKVTTAGDIVYATAANALGRLGVGGVNQVLVGGASAPSWEQGIGSAAANAVWVLTGTAPKLQWKETDAADPNDYWEMVPTASNLFTRFWDDSASAFSDSSKLTPKDFMLHTGNFGTETGAVVIKSDVLGSTQLTTSGTGALAVTITTGGPAHIFALFSIAVTRSAAGSSGDSVVFVPQDDALSISTSFNLTGGNDWADAMIPSNGDTGVYTGVFFQRVTSTNTSVWSVSLSASVNSVFTATQSKLLVVSVQYPT